MAQSTAPPDGRQARWAAHNRERRQKILDAAVVVLESAAPGTEFHVQQIAAEAGLNRTVVYRHFADRADLDQAIQAQILDDLAALLVPAVALDGTIRQIIRRTVSTYVEWVVAHPSLHRFAEHEASGQLQHGLHQIAETLVEVIETVISMLGADLDADERASVDPLAYGLVGAVLGAVRRWVTRVPNEPPATALAAVLSDSVWHILDGHARWLNVALDPDLPIEELLSGATPFGTELDSGLNPELDTGDAR